MRFGAILLTFSLVLALPALTDDSRTLEDVVRPCLAPEGQLEQLVSDLQSEGWQLVQTPEDDLIDELAWIQSWYYLSGDTGGTSLDNILEIQRKAARGLLRKKDIPQSKSRFFQRRDGTTSETLMVAWREPFPQVLQIDCRASVRYDAREFQMIIEGETFYRPGRIPYGNATMDILFFNDARLPDHKPPAYVIHTHYQRVSQ
ncbi:MAG: hypothetical protein AAGI03_18120 [Pseudomonadota bacterium]